MNDPFDCQEFHELCMDYRGAPVRLGGVAYERLQAYCRTYVAKPEPLEFPPIDLGLIEGAHALKHPFEPFELTERS